MFEKSPYISTNQNMKEEDPIEKLNLSLNQLIFSLKNKEAFSSTDIDVSLNSNNEEEDIEKIGDNEGEELLNQFENLNNINKNNNISDEKLNEKIDNKVNKKNFDKNKNIFLEKLKEIKNKNSEFKNEIKEYQNIFNEMIKIVINGVIIKEKEMNRKYKNNINKMKKELQLNLKKMNKLDIDYKKSTNSNLQKFNNIINNNKIEKEQIEKNYKDSLENLEQDKNKLIDEKNKLIEENKDTNDKLDKIKNELMLLEKEKEIITEQNKELKTKITKKILRK